MGTENTQAIAPRRTNAVDRVIGARIQARRTELCMSEQTLSDALAITPEQLQKLERGSARVAASQLMAISQTLNTEVSQLLPLGESPPDAPNIVSELLRFALTLDANGQSQLLEHARVLAASPAAAARGRR